MNNVRQGSDDDDAAAAVAAAIIEIKLTIFQFSYPSHQQQISKANTHIHICIIAQA
jgi:hypothetical protein